MPELPEVETTIQELRPDLLGRRIEGVEALWPGVVAMPPLPDFERRLQVRRIIALGRRGKFILLSLDSGDTLIVHLRMTGHLGVVDPETPPLKHLRLRFSLDDGRELRFTDARMFGRAYLVSDPQEVLGALGPEPFDPTFTPQALAERLNGRRAPVKSLLLDQRLIAGIGNLYADEALFYAGISPRRPAASLSLEEFARLHLAMQRVLWEGIEDRGTSVDNYRRPDGSKGNHGERLAVYGRTGQPCPRCGTAIERTVIGGRGTHYCPRCQV